MRWFKDLYVGYNILTEKSQVVDKIKQGKLQLDINVIALPENDYDVLEIYPSNVLIQKKYKDSDMVVVGIAKGKEEALDMMQLIVMDCYEDTGDVNVKKYILEQMEE